MAGPSMTIKGSGLAGLQGKIMTTEERKTKAGTTLKALVIILLAVVCAQGYLLWRIYLRGSWASHPMASRLFHRGQLTTPHYALQALNQAPASSARTQSAGFDPTLPVNGRDLFAEMQRLNDELNRMLQTSIDPFWIGPPWNVPAADLTFTPAMDVKEETDQYFVTKQTRKENNCST
jgi:hypothetical protein